MNKKYIVLFSPDFKYIIFPGFQVYHGYHIPHSHSMDKTVNKYGRSLINLCASNNLCILNGRIQGDRFGKFTCHKSNGASVVDYAILSNTLLRKVVYFSVLPLSFLSCHCPISFAIKTNKFFLIQIRVINF